MQKVKKWFFLLFTALFFFTCSDTSSSEASTKIEGISDQESWGVEISITDAGVKRAIVRSGHLEKFNNRYFVLLDQNVEIDFFDEDENHTSRLTSSTAEIDERSDYMRAMENVVVTSDSGITLLTDTLSWDHLSEMIYTDGSVRITTENNDTLYGIGFESDVQMNYWKILQPSGVTNRANGK